MALGLFELAVACCCSGWLDVDGPSEAGMATALEMARKNGKNGKLRFRAPKLAVGASKSP